MAGNQTNGDIVRTSDGRLYYIKTKPAAEAPKELTTIAEVDDIVTKVVGANGDKDLIKEVLIGDPGPSPGRIAKGGPGIWPLKR